MAELDKTISVIESWLKQPVLTPPPINELYDALELLKVYKKKIESESEKTTLIDEALEVGRCVLRRGIYLPGFDKQWIRVSMTIKEAEKIFGTLRQMKDKQT